MSLRYYITFSHNLVLEFPSLWQFLRFSLFFVCVYVCMCLMIFCCVCECVCVCVCVCVCYVFPGEGMATHSYSTLAWKLSWTEEPGRLPSMRSQGVGHGWTTLFTYLLTFCVFTVLRCTGQVFVEHRRCLCFLNSVLRSWTLGMENTEVNWPFCHTISRAQAVNMHYQC